MEKQNCCFRPRISTVLSSWDSPLTAFLPIFFSKKHKKNTLAKKPTFQKNLLKPTKYQHFHLPKSSQKIDCFFSFVKKQKRQKSQKNMKKPHFAKTSLKPTKYQHLHLPGRSQGPLQTTKITPRGAPDPLQTPRKNLLCFRCLPRTPRGPPRSPPRTPRGPPRTPPRTPQDPRRTPRGPPRTPRTPRGPPRNPPRTP